MSEDDMHRLSVRLVSDDEGDADILAEELRDCLGAEGSVSRGEAAADGLSARGLDAAVTLQCLQVAFGAVNAVALIVKAVQSFRGLRSGVSLVLMTEAGSVSIMPTDTPDQAEKKLRKLTRARGRSRRRPGARGTRTQETRDASERRGAQPGPEA